MTYLIGLVLLLVVLAGVIAFLGDRLGTFVGRHRLSLFGARPRVTGQIVGVMAGIVIMLTTLIVLALANRTATSTLIGAQQTAAELTELRAEQRVLQSLVRDLERDLEDGSQLLEASRAELDAVTAQRDAAQSELERAVIELDALASEQVLLEGEISELRGSMAVVQAELDDFQTRLQVAQLQLEQASQRQALAENEAERAQAAAGFAEAAVIELQEETVLLEDQLRQIGLQVADLDEQSVQLRAENELLQGMNESLAAQNVQLTADNAQLAEQNTLLGQVNSTLRQQFEESNARVRELEVTLQVLELNMEDGSRRLSELQDEIEQITQGEITFRTDDLIYSGLVRADGLSDARAAIAAFVRAANVVTAQRGAGEIELSAAQFDSLASVVAQSEEDLVITLISPRNQLRSATLEVAVEAYENTEVLGKGQLVTSKAVHLGTSEQPTSQSDLRADVLELVQETRRRLTTAGFFSQEAPSFSQTEDLFVAQVQRLNGRAVIGVITREPVNRGGPALLEFVIIN